MENVSNDYQDDDFNRNDSEDYEQDCEYDFDDQRTLGQKSILCDQFDNCYSCPYSQECF